MTRLCNCISLQKCGCLQFIGCHRHVLGVYLGLHPTNCRKLARRQFFRQSVKQTPRMKQVSAPRRESYLLQLTTAPPAHPPTPKAGWDGWHWFALVRIKPLHPKHMFSWSTKNTPTQRRAPQMCGAHQTQCYTLNNDTPQHTMTCWPTQTQPC